MIRTLDVLFDISMMFGSNSHFLLEVQTLFIIQLVNNGPNCE